MDEHVKKFKALGDETRFKLFRLLSENRICVRSLAKRLGISESAVSQHLKVLRGAGLVKGEKIGYFVHYEVQKDALKQLQGVIGELSKDIPGLGEQKKGPDMDPDCTSQRLSH
jgi:ArsR family transcriptional regulator